MSTTEPKKTIWKKNLDNAFISGEDLKLSIKGLKPEMVVVITGFKDEESFDQNKQAKRIVTGLYLKELNGVALYKPCIMNKTNAKFLVKELGSEYMEDWVGKPFTIYAMADSRHGQVVRFKKYSLPVLVKDSENFVACKKAIDSKSYTLEQIKTRYVVSADVEKALLTPPTT